MDKETLDLSILQEWLVRAAADPLGTATRMETLASRLLEAARKIRESTARGRNPANPMSSGGSIGDQVTIKVVRGGSQNDKGEEHGTS